MLMNMCGGHTNLRIQTVLKWVQLLVYKNPLNLMSYILDKREGVGYMHAYDSHINVYESVLLAIF